MKKLVLAVCFVSAVAFAEDKAMDAKAGDKSMGGMMAGWTPRKVTNEDKKGIEAALESHHKAWMSGDMSAVAATVDFPVFMATDDKDGNVMTTMHDQATWTKMMEPSMKAMMADKDAMAAMAKMPKPKMEMFFITDTMALVDAKMQRSMGKQKMETRNALFMVNKGGKWMIKGQIEGGWGDMAKSQMSMMDKPAGGEMKPATAAAPAAPAKPAGTK